MPRPSRLFPLNRFLFSVRQCPALSRFRRAAVFFPAMACLAAALCMAFPPMPVMAENIVWYGPGDSRNIGTLRIAPYGGAPSVLPSGPSGNTVAVYGDVNEDENGSVYGGLDYSPGGKAEASGNTVRIFGGRMSRVYGGYAYAEADTAIANNSVWISGGTVQGNVYGGEIFIFGGSTASANNNSVWISGGTVQGNIFGGDVYIDEGGTASANNNSVWISGGTVQGNVYGGEIFIFGGSTASANNNSVKISGGSVAYDVRGGMVAIIGDATASANNNSVWISGGTVQGYVYGGYAYATSGTATAINNTITFSGAPVFGDNSNIYGGRTNVSLGVYDGFTGNTLRLWDYQGSSTLNEVANFEFYDFILPANMADGDVLFAANAINFGGDHTNLSDSAAYRNSRVAALNVMGGGTPLQAGDALTLLQANNTAGNIEYNGVDITSGGTPLIQGQKGVSLLYTFRLSQENGSLIATVEGSPRITTQVKALSEGRIAGLAFTNQGADLLAWHGMQAALGATRIPDSLAAFGAAQAGTSRYTTGSHVDVDGFSLLAGLGASRPTGYGDLLLGAFFEAGWGNYDSHNSFTSRSSVSASGETRYQGGGILGRFDGNGSGSGHAYAEASLRAGWTETDFSSSDLTDGTGAHATYDSGAAYYGAHAGVGYVWNLNEADSLDFSLKYLWTHQQGDSVTVTGDPIRFKASDSHRVRAGARYGHDFTQTNGTLLTLYAGAGYEHEFDARARATAYGLAIDTPNLKGGTVMGEAGMTLKPSSLAGFSLDVGLQGYLGKREGVTGRVAVKYEF